MKVTANGHDFIVSFQYSPHKEIRKGRHPKRHTTCIFKHVTNQDDKPTVILEGSVSNHSQDPFVRSWGRSLAFAKTLSQFLKNNAFGVSVEDKDLFVNAFYEQCPKSRNMPIEHIEL